VSTTIQSAPASASARIIEISRPRVHNLHHVALRTPKLEESVDFFVRVLGMHEVRREGGYVYLKAYGEWSHHSLILIGADRPGLDHMGWQVAEPEHLEGWVRRFEEQGLDYSRLPAGSELGQGDAVRFTYPGGQVFELFYDFDRCTPLRPSRLRNQPDRIPMHGIPVRRLDHINVMASDVNATRDFLSDRLGFKLREAVREPDGSDIGVWMSVTSQVHDIAVMRDATGQDGRLHHIAFYVDSPDGVLRAAEIFAEEETAVEAGPGKHGLTQAFFIYVFEPGGNRVELFSGGYAIHNPDWQPIIWKAEEVERAIIWYGSPLPEPFFSVAT
jgi:catechol 2,3-dioxygenase